jgi:hypothetical protein
MHSAGAVTCVQPAIGAAAVAAGVVGAAVSGTVVAGTAVVVGATVSTAVEADAVGGGAVLEELDVSSEHAANTPSTTTAIAATRLTN